MDGDHGRGARETRLTAFGHDSMWCPWIRLDTPSIAAGAIYFAASRTSIAFGALEQSGDRLDGWSSCQARVVRYFSAAACRPALGSPAAWMRPLLGSM